MRAGLRSCCSPCPPAPARARFAPAANSVAADGRQGKILILQRDKAGNARALSPLCPMFPDVRPSRTDGPSASRAITLSDWTADAKKPAAGDTSRRAFFRSHGADVSSPKRLRAAAASKRCASRVRQKDDNSRRKSMKTPTPTGVFPLLSAITHKAVRQEPVIPRTVATSSARGTTRWPGRSAFQASLSETPAAAARPASRSLIVT